MTRRIQGSRYGSSTPESSYREPVSWTFPLGSTVKAESRNPQASRLSAPVGSGGAGWGVKRWPCMGRRYNEQEPSAISPQPSVVATGGVLAAGRRLSSGHGGGARP